jgi:hypothetical protein
MNNQFTKWAILLFLIITVAVGPAWAKESGKGGNSIVDSVNSPYFVPRTEAPVKVDGALNDKAWENALMIELKYEVEPGENVPASVRTICLLTYNKSHFYAAFRAFDPSPGDIRAYLNDRDSALTDDWVGIVLDTFNDERRAFDIRSNPHGVQIDGIRVENETDFSWDAIWDSAGKIYDWGYAVEMAIPFNSLRFQQSEEMQVWSFDAVRYHPRSHKNLLSIFPRDRSNNCYLCQAVKIKGFEGARPGLNIEISPTLTGVRTDQRIELPGGDFEKANSDTEAGFTAQWGITSNMTLSAAVNPDFSQVEADALQLDINQPFALYYPEKRHFFTEGSDFFNPRVSDFLDTNLKVIYTRTIRDPSWGLKMTGKAGANTIGIYTVRDRLTNLIFPGNQGSMTTSLAMANFSSVFRYRRDIGSKYSFGVLATDREGNNYFNRLIGIDSDFRITKRDRLQIQLLGSSTRYPDEVAAEFGQKNGAFTGMVVDLNYRHNTRTLDYWARLQSFGQGFRADLGFMPRVDCRRYRVGSSYSWNARPGSWYSMLELASEVDIRTDLDGKLINGGAYVWGTFLGPMQSSLTLILGKSRQVYNSVEFDQYSLSVYSGLQPTKNLVLSLEAIFGDHVDYENTRPAKRELLSPGIGCNLGRHLKLNFSYVFERLNVKSGRLYTANIGNTSIIYQFNRRTFLRSILQYVDYNYNAHLYTFEIEPRYKHLFTQFLFSYKINPRTVLFLGYSDNYLGNQEYKIAKSDYTFFVKIGYALQL